jgi:hypothetical protein
MTQFIESRRVQNTQESFISNGLLAKKMGLV